MHHCGSRSHQDEARRQLSACPASDTDGAVHGGGGGERQNDWTHSDVRLENSGPVMNSFWLSEQIFTRKKKNRI